MKMEMFSVAILISSITSMSSLGSPIRQTLVAFICGFAVRGYLVRLSRGSTEQ